MYISFCVIIVVSGLHGVIFPKPKCQLVLKSNFFISFSFGSHFIAFKVTFVTWITQPIIRVEHNSRMSISVFDNLVAIFYILGNFHHLDHSANHQKVNIIQKQVFHFMMIWQPFYCISGDFCHSDCLANHQKLNIIQK